MQGHGAWLAPVMGGPVGLGIGILLLQQVQALLNHSTDGGEAIAVHQRPGEGWWSARSETELFITISQTH